MTGFRDLRRNHDFTALWVGSTVSELGTRVSMFVFPLIAYGLTGSTVVAGIAGRHRAARHGARAPPGRRPRRPRRTAAG